MKHLSIGTDGFTPAQLERLVNSAEAFVSHQQSAVRVVEAILPFFEKFQPLLDKMVTKLTAELDNEAAAEQTKKAEA